MARQAWIHPVAITLNRKSIALLVALRAEHEMPQSPMPINIMGGCCGTDHRHVAAIADACLSLRAAAWSLHRNRTRKKGKSPAASRAFSILMLRKRRVPSPAAFETC